ncbi:unnamed protein product [Anisakis simplex]|uniref:DUF148 domain-containing protein n=1 Tax=Anisakis simplex TaxID=6269 RepID=A0A0M3K537_ANISI|nr:unnamed protein product [Anisakis simplex]
MFVLLATAVFAAPQASTDVPVPMDGAEFLPKFLEDSNEEGRKQFWTIITSKDATVANIEAKLNEWASKQSEQVQKDYEHAKDNLKKIISALKEAVEKSSLSAAAKDAFKMVDSIVSNTQQTFPQQVKAIFDYIKSLPEKTRQELRQVLQLLVLSIMNPAKFLIVLFSILAVTNAFVHLGDSLTVHGNSTGMHVNSVDSVNTVDLEDLEGLVDLVVDMGEDSVVAVAVVVVVVGGARRNK